MRKPFFLYPLLVSSLLPAQAAMYGDLSKPLCDEVNKVIYDGKGNFAVQSSADNTVELTINLASFLSYANSNDYKSGTPLLLWDTNLVDYGLTDMADTKVPTGSRKPAITGYWAGKIWQNAGKIEYDTLQQYASADGNVTLRITGSSSKGVTVSAIAPDGTTKELYKASNLRAGGNKTLSGYQLNLNYAKALSLHTPSTLDTSSYVPPADYTAPFKSKRTDGTSLGRLMFMGDSITHGVNDQTWRWQLFKILVDNGIEAEIVGPRSGYTPGYTQLTTKDAGESYGGVPFPNVHLAQSSGRTHNIISGSNAGMSGVNYGGHSTASSADSYNCDTWCCLMGTNDLLSDAGYTPDNFADKMQRMLGGRVAAKGNNFTWTPGSKWGNLGKIATDVLRDKNDTLYIMSVPCWGNHGNNNEPARHETVQKYNELLKKWVETYSKKSGLKIRFVEINQGLVDPAAGKPFTWPDSMSNRPGRDGLHPNEQGSLIIAGNLARAMGIAGRTAGLPRAAADKNSKWTKSTKVNVKPGTPTKLTKGVLSAKDGYTVELSGDYSKKAILSVTLNDGSNSGTLSMGNGRICWGDTPLYCDAELKGTVRIAWNKGNSAQNLLPGYYVWVGDTLIGQGLTHTANGGENGIQLTVEGGSLSLTSASWTTQSYAPESTGRSSAEYAYNPQKCPKAQGMQAGIKADAIFADHMVLQRGQNIPITGTCSGTEPVTVSFNGQTVTGTVTDGRWTATLAPMSANATGQQLTITQGSGSQVINDILVGEVWVASGQSNMLWRLNQTGDTNSLNEAENPQFRFHHGEPQVHTSPPAYKEREKAILQAGEMYKGSWSTNTPQTRQRMSAVGYYFGRELQKHLGVPVGVIHAALGGSEMMAWMPPAVLQEKYADCLTEKWLDSKYMSAWVRGRARQNIGSDLNAPHPYKPAYLFETGIKPWLNFPVAGVIWYQGESDAEIQDMEQNYALLHDLIDGWRTSFNRPELPFLQVELPRINDRSKLRAYWPEFRTVQRRATRMKNVYALTTIDLGSKNSDVHPPRKLEVGTRLANLAAAKIYDKKVPCSGPTITKVVPQGKKIHVHFSHAKGLKTTDGKAPVGFDISEDGNTYYPAEATIKGTGVELSSPQVQKPRYARYGWYTYLEPNLVNEDSLPTQPYVPAP